jgi:hypothetical protein
MPGSKLKKALRGFLFFILFLFLFDRGLFFLISTLEAGFYSKNKFEKRFETYVRDKSFSTLIFGTSRSYEGIHPYYFKKELGQNVFKETFQGKGPKYNYYFYQLYKKYAGIPKVVIYGVDYFIYTVTSDPKWMARFNRAMVREHWDWLSTPLLLLKYKRSIDNFSNNVLIRMQEKENPDASEKSFEDFLHMQEYIGAAPLEKKLVTHRPYKYRRQFFPRFPGNEGDYFIKLLDELAKDKVTVILVALPDYFGSYKTNFERKEFALHLKRLERKYKNLFFYNYDRAVVFPLSNPDYFLDGGFGKTNSHLSKTGARLFNHMLIKDLEKYYR